MKSEKQKQGIKVYVKSYIKTSEDRANLTNLITTVKYISIHSVAQSSRVYQTSLLLQITR